MEKLFNVLKCLDEKNQEEMCKQNVTDTKADKERHKLREKISELNVESARL